MFSLNTFTVSRCVSIILGSVFFMLYKDTVVIIILAEERIAIRIRDRHVFDSSSSTLMSCGKWQSNNFLYKYILFVYTMIEIRAELKQWGNSYGIRIPKSVAEKAGLKKGDVVSVPLKKETFAISDFFGICKGAESFERERGLLDRF
jgi:hypothetical protein